MEREKKKNNNNGRKGNWKKMDKEEKPGGERNQVRQIYKKEDKEKLKRKGRRRSRYRKEKVEQK